MTAGERAVFDAALPRLVLRIDEAARAFAALDVGGRLTMPWAPVAAPAGLASRHGGRSST